MGYIRLVNGCRGILLPTLYQQSSLMEHENKERGSRDYQEPRYQIPHFPVVHVRLPALSIATTVAPKDSAKTASSLLTGDGGDLFGCA